MKPNQKMSIAQLIASQIKTFRIARDNDPGQPKGFIDAKELMERYKESIKAPYSRLSLEQARIAGMMAMINALGGKDLAQEICDILEAFDEKESEMDFDERQQYVANFDRLAEGYIDGWYS